MAFQKGKITSVVSGRECFHCIVFVGLERVPSLVICLHVYTSVSATCN